MAAPRRPAYDLHLAALLGTAITLLGSTGATEVLDLNRKLSPNGTFTWTVDGVQVRNDGVHLTPRGVR